MKIAIILIFLIIFGYGFWEYIFPPKVDVPEQESSVEALIEDTVEAQEIDTSDNSGPDPTTLDVVIEVPPTVDEQEEIDANNQ